MSRKPKKHTRAERLRHLQKQLERLGAELKTLRRTHSETQIPLPAAVERQKLREIELLLLAMDNLKLDPRRPIVSEHAMLRYLERVQGVDLVKVESAILTPRVVNAMTALGNGKFPSGTGFRAVVQNNTVVTVETERLAPSESWCGYCGRVLVAANRAEVVAGLESDYVIVHDDVPHDEHEAIAGKRAGPQ